MIDHTPASRRRRPRGVAPASVAALLTMVLAMALLVACPSTPSVPGTNNGDGPGNVPLPADSNLDNLWAAARAAHIEFLRDADPAALAALPAWVEQNVGDPEVESLSWPAARELASQALDTDRGRDAAFWIGWPAATPAEPVSPEACERQVMLAGAHLAAGAYADAIAVCDYEPVPLPGATRARLDEIRSEALARAGDR